MTNVILNAYIFKKKFAISKDEIARMKKAIGRPMAFKHLSKSYLAFLN